MEGDMQSMHIHMSLKRAMEMACDRWYHHKLKAMFGYRSIAKLRADLKAMQKEGLTVIPSEGCDNRAPTGECLGHPEKVKAAV
jgi:hypothetical protein